MSKLKSIVMEAVMRNLAEDYDPKNPKMGYPEYVGKKAARYNSDMSKEERAKHHNNPQVGDTVVHGNTGYHGKVAKVTPSEVHVLYKQTAHPHVHDRRDASFMHQHIHHDGKSHFQVLQF